MAGVLAVELGGGLVLAAAGAGLGVHRRRGDQHLALVSHRVHVRAARPAADDTAFDLNRYKADW